MYDAAEEAEKKKEGMCVRASTVLLESQVPLLGEYEYAVAVKQCAPPTRTRTSRLLGATRTRWTSARRVAARGCECLTNRATQDWQGNGEEK